MGTAVFAGINLVGSEHYVEPEASALESLIKYFLNNYVTEDQPLFLDTSPQYGAAEQKLGDCLGRFQKSHKKLFVATKWGLKSDPDNFCNYDYSPSNLTEQLAKSYVRLGAIDALFLHTNPGVPIQQIVNLLDDENGTLSRMLELKQKQIHGINQLGISISKPDHLRELMNRPDCLKLFDLLQVNANLILDNSYIGNILSRLPLTIVINSIYRKADKSERETRIGRSAHIQRISNKAPDSLLLTGTGQLRHLEEFHNLVKESHNKTPVSVSLHCSFATTGVFDQKLNEDIAMSIPNLLLHRGPGDIEKKDLDNGSVSKTIVNLLMGSRKTRLGPMPPKRHQIELMRRVEKFVNDDRPIDIIVTWGPRKFYAVEEENSVDLCELMALERLQSFQKQVLQVYSRGIRVTLFFEDYEGTFIEQVSPSVFQRYKKGLQAMIEVLGLEPTVSLVATSDWAETFCGTEEIRHSLQRNYEVIRDYWTDSDAHPEQEDSQLESAQAMRAIGFEPPIPQESRTYYLQRLDKLLGSTVSELDKKSMVQRLFACVLLHRKYHLFGLGEVQEPIKFSFLPVAGGPDFLMDGRIDIRTIDTRLSKRSLAPWSGKGYLRVKEDRVLPAMMTWKNFKEVAETRSSGKIQLSSENLTLDLSADIISL
jgi:hypothetical protein